jgi:hypothetical protein
MNRSLMSAAGELAFAVDGEVEMRTGSAPIARAIMTNSITSSRRSQPSYLGTKD